jgi:hypothetical protein
MRHKSLLSMLTLLFVVLSVTTSFSDNPYWKMTWKNDTHVGNVYSFDVYVQSVNQDGTPASTPIELAAFSLGVRVPLASINGGTITGSIVAGSSELTTTSEIPTAVGGSTVGSYRIIKVAGKTPPSAGSGSLLSVTAPGTKMFRLSLSNSVAWVITSPNTVDIALNAEYAWSLNAYVAAINTNVNSTMLPLVVNMAGPLLPVELKSFQSNVSGRTVVLNWSTSTEKNSDRFEIQRSSATTSFVTVSSVKASVLSNSTKEYTYTDNKLQSGKYQYRLKMIDNDGSFTYSQMTESEVAVPKDFQVSQNYPNPFNPSTKIDYQVPVDAKVLLEVYNIAGQKVMELVNGQMSAGYYTIDFGASKLSSGVYIYRLAAVDATTGNNFSSIKKMMLLK